MSSFIPVFLANLFFSFHYALTLFVNSSFLGKFFSTFDVSLLFSAGAISAIVLLFLVPHLLRRYDLRRLLIVFLVMQFVANAALVVAPSNLTVALAFVLFQTLPFGIYYLLDIFLEHLSLNRDTGAIRGGYLTCMNIAIACAPIIATSLVLGEDLRSIYALALFMLLPIFVLAMMSFRWRRKVTGESHTPHHLADFNLSLKKWYKKTDIRRVTIARFVLEFFFAVMTIYVPLYLHRVVGFSWTELGFIFTIMLMPYILFEWPVGRLADKWCGEKEFMTVGFFMIGVTLLIMPFIGKSVVMWTTILFLSRVGASFVEVTTETYFFKKVNSGDTGLIGIFRTMRPFSIVLGSIIGFILVTLLPQSAMFLGLSIVIFMGMREAVYIKDTL